MPLLQIKDRFQETLQGWDDLYRKHVRPMALLFSISLGLDLYVDSRFLFAVQANELYDRFNWKARATPEHKARLKSIYESTSDRVVLKWLKQTLAWSHEPTLRERLNRAIDHAGAVSLDTLRPNFSKVAADTRNYLTRYDDTLKGKAAQGEDLWPLSLEAMALLELCFLHDLGYNSSEALSMSSNTPLFRSIRQHRPSIPPPSTVGGS